MNKLRKLR